MELLLLLLRHSGYQLRSDDPQALKQIVALVKEKSAAAVAGSGTEAVIPESDGGEKSSIAEETDRWKEAFASSQPRGDRENEGDDNTAAAAAGGAKTPLGGSRARYILDTILELQGNKRSRIQEQGQESGRRVRKWLGSVKAAKGGGGGGAGGGGDASLRVTWSELVSTENKGRWWRVGAAWAGRGASASSSPAAATVDGRNGGDAASAGGSTGGGGANDSEAVGLLALAARQRMNTDVRRSVFVAIVGSSDCEDALEKILRLNLKGAQEREIARVIVECCSQEGSYNPFYAHLAERVCDRQPKLRWWFLAFVGQGLIVLFSLVFGEFYSKSNRCAGVSGLSVGAKCGSLFGYTIFGEVTGRRKAGSTVRPCMSPTCFLLLVVASGRHTLHPSDSTGLVSDHEPVFFSMLHQVHVSGGVLGCAQDSRRRCCATSGEPSPPYGPSRCPEATVVDRAKGTAVVALPQVFCTRIPLA